LNPIKYTKPASRSLRVRISAEQRVAESDGADHEVINMNAILSQNGIVVSKKDIEDVFKNDMQKFLNKLTIKTKVKVGPMKIARLYKYEWVEGAVIRNGKEIQLKHQVLHIPRGYLGNMLSAGIIKNIDILLPPGKPLNGNEFAAELENNQNVIVQNLMQNVFNEDKIKSGQAMCTLNLGAGRGKTFIAANLVSRIARAALYFIPNSSILIQTLEAMKICFPKANVQFYSDIKDLATKSANKIVKAATKETPPRTISLFDESHRQLMRLIADVDVCIIIINSAMLISDEDFFAHFGLMIFDEVHEYCGKKRSEVFWKCQAPCMLGMSATTDEHMYNWDKIYYMHVGEVIHANKMLGYDPTEVKFIGSVKIIKYHGPPGFTENKISEATGYLFTPEMHLQAMNDTCRNMLVICEILLLYLDNTCERNIFVFFERREHVQLIVTMMNNADVMRLACEILSLPPYSITGNINLPAGLAYAPELSDEATISMMRGGSKQEDINKAMQSRIIVTTYGYSKTGVSIVKMNSLIIGTSRKSKFKQTLARAMRLRSDYSIERKFIDIVDWDTAIKSQHYERRKAYVFYELTMNSVDISWELFKKILDVKSLD
jgi:hypothetical protein